MEVLGNILAAIFVVAVTVLLTSLPVMILWNWLMPKIFGLITINLWESMGLILLVSLLFKSSNNDK